MFIPFAGAAAGCRSGVSADRNISKFFFYFFFKSKLKYHCDGFLPSVNFVFVWLYIFVWLMCVWSNNGVCVYKKRV